MYRGVYGGIQWRDCHTKFRKNLSSGSKFIGETNTLASWHKVSEGVIKIDCLSCWLCGNVKLSVKTSRIAFWLLKLDILLSRRVPQRRLEFASGSGWSCRTELHIQYNFKRLLTYVKPVSNLITSLLIGGQLDSEIMPVLQVDRRPTDRCQIQETSESSATVGLNRFRAWMCELLSQIIISSVFKFAPCPEFGGFVTG
jgi:hypothetical protein